MDNYELIRTHKTKEFVIGVLLKNDMFLMHTIERPWLENKKSISCIPEGTYDLGFKESETALTLKYREKYPFFKYHIEVKNVPNRSGIYIHVANYTTDIKGCIGVGMNQALGYVGESVKAYKMLYKQFNGGKLTIKSL